MKNDKKIFGATLLLLLLGVASACTPEPKIPHVEDLKKTCTKSEECASGEVCSAGLCIIGDCMVREDCPHPGDQLCDLNKCVPDPDSPIGNECPNGDVDCDMGEFCSAGTCYEVASSTPCSRSFDCSAGERCDPVNGFCVDDRGGCNRAEEYPELACPVGDFCDALTGQCSPPSGIPCTVATELEDCGESMSCIGERCVQCNANTNCDAEGVLCCDGFGTQCNVATGRCVGAFICSTTEDCTDCLRRPGMGEQAYCSNGSACSSDSECSSVSDRRCSTATGECIHPECTSARDCTSAHDSRWDCDTVNWHCFLPPATCDEDNEPNDGISTAIAFDGQGEYSDLLCRGDTDVIAIPAQANKRLRVNITLSVGGSSTVVSLLDSNGVEVDSADFGWSSDSARVTADVGAEATYYLKLVATDPEYDSYNYTLTVEYLEALNCEDEPGEPNDSIAQSVNSPVSAGTRHFALCGTDDIDYYQITAVANMRTIVDVLFLDNEGNINASLLSLDGTTLDSSSSYDDNEQLHYDAGDSDETLVILIERSPYGITEEQQEYSLVIKTEELPDCQDGYEPNNNEAQAALITAGTFNPSICDDSDDDWYAIDLPSGGSISASITFTDNDGDLDLQLLKAGGTSLDSSGGTSDSEHVSKSGLASGMYYIKVHPYSSDGAQPYQLVVDVDYMCMDDALGHGANSSIESAQSLRDDALSSFSFDEDLKLCSAADDWYRLLLLGDEVLDLHAHGPVGLYAELYVVGEDGELMVAAAAESQPFADENQLDMSYHVPGRGALYYLRLGGGGQSERAYHLSLSTQLDDCNEDAYEYNDVPMLATPFDAPTATFAAGLCAANENYSDVDIYTVPVLSGTMIHASLNFDGSIADLDLMGSLDAQIVASATVEHSEAGAQQILDYTALAPGDFYLTVVRHPGDTGLGIDYQLLVDVANGIIPDAGYPEDGGFDDSGLDDRGIVDSGIADSGIADSGIADAGSEDVFPQEDAGLVDADSNPADAGYEDLPPIEDAGSEDALLTEDAGQEDGA